MTDSEPTGPTAWTLWRHPSPTSDVLEYSLCSDAHVTGELTDGLGPFKVLNTVAGGSGEVGALRPALALRAEVRNLDERWTYRGDRPMDPGSYHGAGLDEEIAALLSLALGFRCRSAGVTRVWRDGDDPQGRPFEWRTALSLAAPEHRQPQLPGVAQTVSLETARDLLSCYPSLSAKQARTLVRAARQYQQAVWLADADPQMAWLFCVSAAEVAAADQPRRSGPAIEELHQAWPELAKTLEGGDPEVAEQAAKMLRGQVRATRKFLDFFDRYAPPPPDERPGEAFQIDWTQLGGYLAVVYGHRSKALHAGIPFPPSMCEPPSPEPGGGLSEASFGLATHVGDAYWPAESAPMLLHVFVHATAEALRGWWAELGSAAD